MKTFYVSAIAAVCLSVSAIAQMCEPASTGLPGSAGAAQLPAICIEPAYPTVTGRGFYPATAAQFQAALNAATGGDQIVLRAGALYQGNFQAPAHGGGTVLIRSSLFDPASPEAGQRVSVSQLQPVVSTVNSGAALTIQNGAGGYYFAGVSFTVAAGVAGVWEVVSIGDTAVTVADLPHDITFHRCKLYGNDQAVVRGVDANAVRFAMIHSQAWGFLSQYQDTQSVLAYNSPGPYLFYDNAFSATGENVMFGGANPVITGVVPGDITMRRNYFYKSLAWKGQPNPQWPYDVKDELEFKNAQRALIDSNVFAWTFAEAQSEFIIVNCFDTPAQAPPGPYNGNDITITNNIFHDGPQVLVIGGNQQMGGLRVTLRNNLAWNIAMLAYFTNAQGFTVDHNTAVNIGTYTVQSATADATQDSGFQYTNNIGLGGITSNAYGGEVTVSRFPSPLISHDLFADDVFFDYVWNGSVAMPSAEQYPGMSIWTPFVSRQPECVTLAQLSAPGANPQCAALQWQAVGFADYAGGASNPAGFALAASSPYHLSGSDGLDLGANVPAVLAATARISQTKGEQ